MKRLLDLPIRVFLLFTIPLFAVLLALVIIALASRVSGPDIDLTSAATPNSNYVNNLQIQVLEAQLEQTRSFGDRLVQIVLWSISGVVTTGAILLGFSWFNNYRATEQERGRLQRAESDVQEVRKDNERLHATLTEIVLNAAISSAGEEIGTDNFPRAYRVLCRAANERSFESCYFGSSPRTSGVLVRSVGRSLPEGCTFGGLRQGAC